LSSLVINNKLHKKRGASLANMGLKRQITAPELRSLNTGFDSGAYYNPKNAKAF